MARHRIPQTGKHIAFDPETRDFALYYDGVWIGYAPTESAGQLRLDEHAYKVLTHRQPEVLTMSAGSKAIAHLIAA